MPGEPVRVLVVDDSSTVRRSVVAALARDPEIQIVGTAPDAYVARDLIVELAPDVVSLDLALPQLDGISFLRRLMFYRPTPVVILSSLASDGGALALEALAAGALAVVNKFHPGYPAAEAMRELAEQLKAAAAARVSRIPLFEHAPRPRALVASSRRLIAFGASTGGTIALERILKALPTNLPGAVVTQHMPEAFTGPFARRLAAETGLDVVEARDGDQVVTGRVLIAPGNQHLVIERTGMGYKARLSDAPKVNRHRPSVDVMFRSVARAAGRDAIGVLLTGMGRDGAEGMFELKQAGATTIAQDEASCVVFGMPRAAIELEAADEVLPLDGVPARLIHHAAAEPTATGR